MITLCKRPLINTLVLPFLVEKSHDLTVNKASLKPSVVTKVDRQIEGQGAKTMRPREWWKMWAEAFLHTQESRGLACGRRALSAAGA